jgi:hypothetical protein
MRGPGPVIPERAGAHPSLSDGQARGLLAISGVLAPMTRLKKGN